MKIKPIGPACGFREAERAQADIAHRETQEEQGSWLLSLREMLGQLPDINHWKIAELQLALQQRRLNLDAEQIAAAMILWFQRGGSR